MSTAEQDWAKARIDQGFLQEFPTEPVAIHARWLEMQDQDAIANCILSSDGDLASAEESFLLWLVDRKLEQANAIRLFWKLFRAETYAGRETAGFIDAEHNGEALSAAVRVIVERFNTGYYPEGPLGIAHDEATYYKHRWGDLIGNAVLRGFNPDKHALYTIPKAFFTQLQGRPVADPPKLRPVPVPLDWMGTDAEEDFRFYFEMMEKRAVEGPNGMLGQTDQIERRLKQGRRDNFVIYGGLGLAALVAVWFVASGGSLTTLARVIMHGLASAV